MIIKNDETAAEAWDRLNRNESISVEISDWPQFRYTISADEGEIILHGPELAGLYGIHSHMLRIGTQFTKDVTKYPTKTTVKYQLTKGSIDISINVSDVLREISGLLPANASMAGRSLTLVGIGLAFSSTALMALWYGLKRIEGETERKKIDFAIKVIEHAKRDEHIASALEGVYQTISHLMLSTRPNSVIQLNGVKLTPSERIQIQNTHRIDRLGEIIDGTFFVKDFEKKEKARFVFTLQMLKEKKRFKVFLNAEFDSKELIRDLQSHGISRKSFWAKLAYDKVKNRAIILKIFSVGKKYGRNQAKPRRRDRPDFE